MFFRMKKKKKKIPFLMIFQLLDKILSERDKTNVKRKSQCEMPPMLKAFPEFCGFGYIH